MMRWIKNFIGRFQGYSGCANCKDTWNWKKRKDIQDSKSSCMFALCEECFNKLDIPEIIYWYEYLLNSHVRSTPIDYTPEKIKVIRQTLKENIIKLKQRHLSTFSEKEKAT